MILMASRCVALLLLHYATSVTRVDKTLEEGAQGTDVIKATVNKITESGIFSDDFQFLRRMAAVETNDGETAIFGDGGIWSVKRDVFNIVNEYMSGDEGQSTLGVDIASAFGFSWSETIGSDRRKLDIPLYSALAVMIHIEMSRSEIVYEISQDIPSQAIILIEIDSPKTSLELQNSWRWKVYIIHW